MNMNFSLKEKKKFNGVDGEEGQIGRQARENQTLRGEGDSWKLWIFFNRKFGHGRCSSPRFFGLLVLIFGFGFFSLFLFLFFYAVFLQRTSTPNGKGASILRGK